MGSRLRVRRRSPRYCERCNRFRRRRTRSFRPSRCGAEGRFGSRPSPQYRLIHGWTPHPAPFSFWPRQGQIRSGRQYRRPPNGALDARRHEGLGRRLSRLGNFVLIRRTTGKDHLCGRPDVRSKQDLREAIEALGVRSIGCSRVGALLDETLFWAGELRGRSGTMASPATLAWCRSSLIEQGQLEVAGAGPPAIAPPLAAPPAN
jgi:hypothetical protein